MAPDFLLIAGDVFAALRAPNIVVTTERGVRIDYIFASSAESVGEFGFGKGAEIVIENKLEYFEGAMSIAAG